MVLAMLSAGVAYFVVNWPLLIGVVHLTTGRSVRQVWAEDLAWMPGPVLVTIFMGAALGLAYLDFGLLGACLVVVPLLALRPALARLAAAAAGEQP
jgi:hypothetical protein